MPGPQARILVVDSDAESQRLNSARLMGARYRVQIANEAQAALDACIRFRPDLVLVDLHLGQSSGMDLLKELKCRWPSIIVIIVTGHATISEAVEATRRGAFGFLVKPVEKAELSSQVERALAGSTLAQGAANWRSDIVARSQLMEERLSIANRAAASDEPVLLTGANGTGKELWARAIHARSARHARPFIAVRCARADERALEIELFGASPSKAGGEVLPPDAALAAARGGTLLIDEIGELPPRLQVELIRALRVVPGGLWPLRSDARLICTTSYDLKERMQRGLFKEELYYNVNILPIEIPPLGRRREDIPLLVSHFLDQVTDGRDKVYSPDAIELLKTADWPGNVRQLFDLVKHHVALSRGRVMGRELVASSLGTESKKVPSYDEARDSFARDYLIQNLQTAAGNVSQAARLAKRNRTDFYKLLARYRVEPEYFKGETGIKERKKNA